MVNAHVGLYWVAIVLFVLAACPTGSKYRFEWFGVACLVLAQLV